MCINSTVSNNRTTLVDGGGIYAFFNAAVRIENSTVSGNVAGNVGGGIRMLGNATIVNSTLSGNTSSAWFGGALFHTDGVTNLVNSTVTRELARRLRQRGAVRRHVHGGQRDAQRHQQHRGGESRSRWQSGHGMLRRAVRQRAW